MRITTGTAIRSPQPKKGATHTGVRSGKLTADVEIVLRSGMSAIRMQKVLNLRRAVRDGSYVVDSEAIADGLLRRAGRFWDARGSRYSA